MKIFFQGLEMEDALQEIQRAVEAVWGLWMEFWEQPGGRVIRYKL